MTNCGGKINIKINKMRMTEVKTLIIMFDVDDDVVCDDGGNDGRL